IWAMPKGSFRRDVSSTCLKLIKIPCAVSGRRYANAAGSSSLETAPIVVRNIRLNGRDSVRSVEPQFEQIGLPSASRSSLSSRSRDLHARQSTNGSLNVVSWPEYFH